METNQKKNDTIPVPLPNANTILLLGIFSIVIAFCCGFFALVGLILGIIALALSPKPLEMYAADPSRYTENSYKNITAGKICAIIGIVISGLLMLAGLVYLTILGGAIGTIFDKIPWENYIN